MPELLPTDPGFNPITSPLPASALTPAQQAIRAGTSTPSVIPPTIPAADLTKANDVNITPADTGAIAKAAQDKSQAIFDRLNSFITANSDMAKTISGLVTPTVDETATTEKIKALDLANKTDIAGFNATPGNTFFTFGRQSQAVMDATALTRQSLVNTLQSQTASRTAKLDAAKFLYDSNRNSLSDTLTLYKATSPENIGTHVNPATGDVMVLTRNPITGEVTSQKAGNIGASKSYTSSDIKIDPNTGDTVFYGVKPDGNVEIKTLQRGSGPVAGQTEITEANGRRLLINSSTGAIIRDLGAVTTGRNSNKIFSTSQLNAGAATAHTTIESFRNFDSDTQNFFINNKKKMDANYKAIDDAAAKGESRDQIENEIISALNNRQDLTDPTKQAISSSIETYLDSKYKKGSPSGISLWQKFINFFK